MKILHIDVKKQFSNLNKLNYKFPKKLALFYTLQYKDLAIAVKKQLQAKKHDILAFRQILGCSILSAKEKKATILLIAEGSFHANNLALQTKHPIYIYNGEKAVVFDEKDLKKLEIRKKTALLKFFRSEKLGILVSTKPGQEKIKEAFMIKKQLEKSGKKAFIFLANNINLGEFENFSIDLWINTACPGLAINDNNLINYQDLPSIK